MDDSSAREPIDGAHAFPSVYVAAVGDSEPAPIDRPRVVPCFYTITVESGGKPIARSTRTYRHLQGSRAPVYFIPPADVDWTVLRPAESDLACALRGGATLLHLAESPASEPIGFSFRRAEPPYGMIRNYVAFHAARVDCHVDGERACAEPHDFFGGWVTARRGPMGSF